MAFTDEEYVPVQFCPCGCVYNLKVSEIRAMGAGRQLDAIDSGRKLDAVILPSNKCEQCASEREVAVPYYY